MDSRKIFEMICFSWSQIFISENGWQRKKGKKKKLNNRKWTRFVRVSRVKVRDEILSIV